MISNLRDYDKKTKPGLTLLNFANILALSTFYIKYVSIGDAGRIKNLSKYCRKEYKKLNSVFALFLFLIQTVKCNWPRRSNNLLYVFHWFLMQIHNILRWTVGSTVHYRKSKNWMMKTVYSKLKIGNFL